MSFWTRATSFCACSIRDAFSSRHLCHGPGKNVPRPASISDRRRRHGLEEPAVVRDEDHGGVERVELALEPLEVRDVEVVRRLVEEEQVGVAAERARERGARQLAAGERPQRTVEIVVREAEPAQDGRGVVAPAVAAGVLEPRLRLGVAVERRLVVRAAGHRLLEPRELLLGRDEVARAGEDVLAQRHRLLERRPLVVQRDARPFLERELAAVLLRLAGEDPQQRRLAGAVRPGERDAVAPLDGERDAVEEDVPRDLLAEVRCDDDCHGRATVDSLDGGGHEMGDPWQLLRVVQLRPDLPVPPDRRRSGRALDARHLRGRPLVADRGRERRRDRPCGSRGCDGRPVRRRRAGLAVELDPLRRRPRGRRAGGRARGRSSPGGSAATRSPTSRGRGRRATCSACARVPIEVDHTERRQWLRVRDHVTVRIRDRFAGDRRS